MSKHLGAVIAVVALCYGGATLFLYFGQRQLLYFPTPEVDIKGFDLVEVESAEQTLDVWAARSGESGDAIIYFGGNAESLVYTATLLKSLFPNKNLYLPNYRGYGGSGGEPSEEALYNDALALYDWLEPRHGRVSVIGRSLGSGVATYLASQRELEHMVLVTPYDSIERVASDTFYVFPVSWLLKDKYDSISRADQINTPTLVIIAENDEIIARPHSDRLFKALEPGGAEQVVVDGASHNDIATHREYAMALLIFLDSEHVPTNVQ